MVTYSVSLLGGNIAILCKIADGTGQIVVFIFNGKQHGAVGAALDAAGGSIGNIGFHADLGGHAGNDGLAGGIGPIEHHTNEPGTGQGTQQTFRISLREDQPAGGFRFGVGEYCTNFALLHHLAFLQDGIGGLGIESTGGFIAQQHLGVGGQRPRDGDTLLLAAGKLGRVGRGFIAQAHQLQQ